MARKNNKGFSLVEIIIAITILSLLLAPIVKQISQGFRTSRMAKKQQYLNDHAVYLMEDFQKSSLDELEDKYKNEEGNNIITSSGECMVYDKNGNEITDDADQPLKVAYHYIRYELPDEVLGADKSNFKQTVILDDLTIALKGEGYKPYVAEDDYVLPNHFKKNSEGNVVMYYAAYEALGEAGPIAAIVCEPTTAATNPNSINLGNMQDLDSSKVAIIPGTASNFDAQADKAFFAMGMERLKEVDYDSWNQAITHVDSDSILNQSYNLDKTKKLTLVTIKSEEETVPAEGGGSEKKTSYTVKVDVCYQNTMTFDTKDVNLKTLNASLRYNVFSQKFYTTECPAIYLEYQPYTTEYNKSGAKNAVTYTANDYIMVDNYVENANIYIYKPFEDQMNVVSAAPESKHENGGTMYVYCQKFDSAGNALTTKVGDKMVVSNPVKIHVCNANNKNYKSTIYTNISIDDNYTVGKDYFSSLFTDVKADDVNANTRTDYGEIKKLTDDTREAERLYTINVMLEPADDNAGSHSVTLTGAKGEN